MRKIPGENGRAPAVRLELRFYGEAFDPDEITRILGIAPSSAFRPGDPITESGEGSRRSFGWRLSGSEREGLDVQDLLREFRERVSPPAGLICQVCEEMKVRAVIFCGVRQRETDITPALVFPPEFVRWVSEFGGAIEVDVLL